MPNPTLPAPNFDLTGHVAIITGASSGLGHRFSKVLAGAGAKVAIAARRFERLRSLSEEITEAGGRALPIELDVIDPDSVRKAVTTAEEELGPIRILVNNSGVSDVGAALDLEEPEWDRVLGTNLKGAWLMAQETAQHMVRLGHGGSIINISSIMAERASSGTPAYAASKGGLAQLTRALAVEWAKHEIRVNAIAPGYVETEINRDFFQTELGQRVVRRIPQRRLGAEADLDGALILLASEASAFMTGSVIVVDGGHSIAL